MRRAIFDLASQVLPLSVALLDRLVLTGLLVRVWGVETFEQWSVLVATVTMLSIADLGSQISFSNRMATAAHSGDLDLAARIFRESNSIFLGLALVVTAFTGLLAFLAPVQHLVGLPTPIGGDDKIVLLAVGVSIAAKMAMSNQNGVYRANLAFARGTAMASSVDLLRVLLILGAVLGGATIAGAAVATALAVVIGNVVLVPLDIARRHPRFRYRMARPTALTTAGQLRLGLLYSLPFVPSVIMIQLPVMIIGSAQAATGVLASFVLLRTLSNFLRLVVQKFTFVLGMELARLQTQRRVGLATQTYRLSCRFVACLFGFATGALLGFGGDLVQLWVGDRNLYDPRILLVMLLPLVLTPTVQIASPYLTYSNRPGPVAVGIIAQAAIALLLGFALPIDDIALRLTVAIFGTELIPLAPILIRAAQGRITSTVLVDEALSSLIAVAIALATYLAVIAVRPFLPGLAAAAVAGAALSLLFGLLLAAGFARPFQRWRASL